jgi:hypothetical protein
MLIVRLPVTARTGNTREVIVRGTWQVRPRSIPYPLIPAQAGTQTLKNTEGEVFTANERIRVLDSPT